VDDIDKITGLPKHGQFLRSLEKYIADSQRHDQPLSLLGLNVDHLAYFNYAYGPSAGDAALGMVATILRAEFHTNEGLYRSMGDEFRILLPNTALPEALVIAEHMRQAAISVDLIHPQPHAPQRCLTFSFGVAIYPTDGKDMATLLATISNRIEQAKRDGRNTICYAVHQKDLE